VATDPPYLLPAGVGAPTIERFLGRYILEGSKPGASAAAVWLSHRVLPLNEKGYGYLIQRTMAGARRLHAALFAAELAPFGVVLLPVPDINIVCYVATHPSIGSLESLNAFNERIYTQLSLARPDGAPEYIISRTRLHSPMYDGAVDPVLTSLGRWSVEDWRAHPGQGLVVLRSTVMDPFLAAPPPAPDHVTGYVAALRAACHAVLT
jgi:glutamate/tyrosine decarboxylase-like PLP-dependent enzyme